MVQTILNTIATVITIEKPGAGAELRAMAIKIIEAIGVPLWLKPFIPIIVDTIVTALNSMGVFKTSKPE